ncbi:MAG: GNAT family N-acetyltransferase [Anaerolineae bacterium]|nr:GNAT family N-acetyltransferase [Anaerolineae bacterium]
MNALHFRPATLADWPLIADLLIRHRLPQDGAQAHLADFLLAFHTDGRLAGVAGLERYGDSALLRSVAVAHRRTGVGTQLVERLLQQAAQTGIRQVGLLTETAADYFPRFGFRVIPRTDLPAPLHQSIEFTTACSQSAVAMLLDLGD